MFGVSSAGNVEVTFWEAEDLLTGSPRAGLSFKYGGGGDRSVECQVGILNIFKYLKNISMGICRRPSSPPVCSLRDPPSPRSRDPSPEKATMDIPSSRSSPSDWSI